MHLDFYKYHGTGNDFIMIDGRGSHLLEELTPERVSRLCHRRTGVGADGLIVIEASENDGFYMHYYNADGYPGSMCGNGGRCSVLFAHHLGMINFSGTFQAMDGSHFFKILAANEHEGKVSISLNVNGEISTIDEAAFELNTGSPHYVKIVPDLTQIDVFAAGKSIRYSPAYAASGINVNFVQLVPGGIKMATYERGVEDVTLSCGTGVTASALVAHHKFDYSYPLTVETYGGKLKVDQSDKIYLTAQAVKVFQGNLSL